MNSSLRVLDSHAKISISGGWNSPCDKVKAVTYEVLVQKKRDGFAATVLGLPDCTVEAPTRVEAIRRAKEAAASLISNGELVRIEVDSGSTAHRSIRDFGGMWAKDDTFDEFVEAISAYRQEVDADEPSARGDA